MLKIELEDGLKHKMALFGIERRMTEMGKCIHMHYGSKPFNKDGEQMFIDEN